MEKELLHRVFTHLSPKPMSDGDTGCFCAARTVRGKHGMCHMLDILPTELLNMILSKCGRASLMNVAGVSKELRLTVKSQQYWNSLRIRLRLPEPKLRARQLKTSWDVVHRFLCGNCLSARKSAGKGLCRSCQQLHESFCRYTEFAANMTRLANHDKHVLLKARKRRVTM